MHQPKETGWEDIECILDICVCMLSHFSHVQLFATLQTVAHQAPLSMGFSKQEYWSGLLCSPPGDHLISGIKPTSLMSLTLAGRFFTTSTTWEAPVVKCASLQFHLPHHLLDPQTVLHTLFYTVRLTCSHYGSQCNDLFCLLIVKTDNYYCDYKTITHLIPL